MNPLKFVSGKAGKRFARKFKRTIHLVDSTTIPLIASCMDWARHRRRKAAAKCHVRLDLQSFLPRFAIMDTARHADAKRAREVCAELSVQALLRKPFTTEALLNTSRQVLDAKTH